MTPQLIARHWTRYQPLLFPTFERDVGTLTDRHRELVLVLDTLRLERFFSDGPWALTGRPPVSRLALARAFIAKAVLNLVSTRMLIERLGIDPQLRRMVGFETERSIPSEATFSNAFAEFSADGRLTSIHASMVREAFDGRIVGHVSRDATAVPAREKMTQKVEPPPKAPKKRGRPRKEEIRVKEPATRIEKQLSQSVEDMLAELPCRCDLGTKKGSKGLAERWRGYKLHLDVDDNGIPLSCLLTSASLNDSQVAIPLEALTGKRVISLYSLMDKGYDAAGIRTFVRSQGKVPLIQERKRRGQEPVLFEPDRAVRFRIRTTVERTFARLKDELGARHVRVRGGAKVMGHMMFGILSLTALGLLALPT